MVLTDFGIAQVEGDPSITSTGMLVGAPSYISPERARGHKPGPAADLWSLGGLLYAAVEGVPPYDKGSAIATPDRRDDRAGRPAQERRVRWRSVIYGLLAKDPEQRLDDDGARALLTDVLRAPEPRPGARAGRRDQGRAAAAVPDEGPGKGGSGAGGSGGSGGSGAKRGEEAGERLRGAMRLRAEGCLGGRGGHGGGRCGGDGAGQVRGRGGNCRVGYGYGFGFGYGSGHACVRTCVSACFCTCVGEGRRCCCGYCRLRLRLGRSPAASASAGKASGWPVAPERPPRPVPRAPLTDVVPRRTLVIIAVVVALAVLGTVLALTLNGGDDTSNDSKSGDTKAASSGATAGSGSESSSGAHTDSDDGSAARPRARAVRRAPAPVPVRRAGRTATTRGRSRALPTGRRTPAVKGSRSCCRRAGSTCPPTTRAPGSPVPRGETA